VGTLIRHGAETIFYSGDVNFEDQTVMRAASFPEQPLDTLIIETTRGDAVTPPGFTRETEEQRFGDAINEVLAGGGCVFIPVFALGKTQELLSMFQEFFRRRRVPEVPIYIGGLSTKLTEVFDRLTPKNGRHSGQPLLDAHELFTLAGTEAAGTKLRGRRIYALSSGMMTEQTLSNRLARQILSGPENALFTVGYADPDSPAGKLMQTPNGGEFQLSSDAPAQAVRCRRETFSFSGHASRESVVAFIKKVAPKNVILVHGDEPALGWFRETLARELPRTRLIIPEPGVTIEVG
jgi:Cft2 family RNA processing exonuclease